MTNTYVLTWKISWINNLYIFSQFYHYVFIYILWTQYYVIFSWIHIYNIEFFHNISVSRPYLQLWHIHGRLDWGIRSRLSCLACTAPCDLASGSNLLYVLQGNLWHPCNIFVLQIDSVVEVGLQLYGGSPSKHSSKLRSNILNANISICEEKKCIIAWPETLPTYNRSSIYTEWKWL